MYRYDEFDHAFVQERVAQFRDQVTRRLNGELTEEEFRPLRLMNGLYLQLHAYMLRVAIPYGVLSSRQLHKLADIATKYDRGYAHFTTRQNLQYNWPRLEDMPDILDELASVEMHALQTSGNCIRNITADQYAGVAADEIEDPRICGEILRQWSSLHPEFSFLPRKFKIAITGSPRDRAAIKLHDIGIVMVRNPAGETGCEFWVGGGQGRTPVIAKCINAFVPRRDMLSYSEAILRVYNMHGRRDNIYKARIKILVNEIGIDEFRRQTDEQWALIRGGALDVPAEEIARITAYFAPPAYEKLAPNPAGFVQKRDSDPAFAAWLRSNVAAHKIPGYAIVNISLKPIGGIPGDATDVQMHVAADLAKRYSFDELRVTHEQNLTFADVRQSDLYDLWRQLGEHGLATPNIGLVSDIIACPGLDYCALANARSIPVAQRISERFADLKRQHDIGDLKIKISGCINACGHHHVGHIGILGVDKKGTEFYQITLGGSADENASIGEILGAAFSYDEVVDAVEKVVETYLKIRTGPDENFLAAVRRAGIAPFKDALYAVR
ncbi:MAG: sulfite reductase (NADPH) hemoprotein beta-component [Alphaproteobacteria bacterium]|nr:sulfite reductase (NADPH) hemoprotein beta-component [Alphaproteobacteria bacterium]